MDPTETFTRAVERAAAEMDLGETIHITAKGKVIGVGSDDEDDDEDPQE
jgi:hypothetical protein